MLGNDVTKLQVAIEPIRTVLETLRNYPVPITILHTREGHRADMSDVHHHKNSKKVNGIITPSIGEIGPMGRILLRGEPGHDIIPELYPLPGEPIIDKPGKVNQIRYCLLLLSLLKNMLLILTLSLR